MLEALNCHIDIVSNKKNKKSNKHLNFKFEVPMPEVKDTLMNNFCDLQLASVEKQELTRQHRTKILHFKNLNPKTIKKYSNELIKNLKSLNDENITIVASDVGAYICLAAIFSGRLPTSINWTFALSEAPLALFPKELIQKEVRTNIAVTFELGDNCWLKPFKTLYSAPNYLPLFTDQIQTKVA